MTDTSDLILSIAGGGGLSTIILGGIGYLQKRGERKHAVPRDTAETNNIVITQIVEQNKRLDGALTAALEQISALQGKVRDLEDREDARDDMLRKHDVWDDTVEEMLRRQIPAIHWPTRPPLSPPQG